VIALLCAAGVSASRPSAVVGDIGMTVFLGGLNSEMDDIAVTHEAFHIARAIAGRRGSGSFVTVGRLGRSGPGALSRTCGREWPTSAVKSIEIEYADTGDAARVAAVIVAELLTGDTEPDIVLRADGVRAGWTMRSSPLPAVSKDIVSVGPDSVLVVTGGGRGVTAACARALAHAYRPRIALIGRTSLTDGPPELAGAQSEADLRAALVAQARAAGDRPRPAAIEAEVARILAVREVRATLADIAAAGSDVRYLVADVGDLGSLRAALDEARDAWGPITGVVHGAGVLADRLVAEKTDEQFARVLRVKAEGFRNLLDLVEADDPALVCLFSSVVVSAGNAGQCDYGAANEIAEGLALDWRARHPGCLVKAIAWGPWSGGMVGPELAAVFHARNVPLIPLEAGAEAFVRELTGPASEVRSLITAGGETPASRGGGIAVSETSREWLADHRIGGRAVVPLAVVCDWMVRLVDTPEAVTLHDLDVVHGIAAPASVTVRREGSAFSVVTSAAELCYRARLAEEDALEHLLQDHGVKAEPEGLTPPTSIDPLYDGETLFHGPKLWTLRRIEGVGPTGAVGDVVGVCEMAWPDEPWRIDPAALDGAIQLAVVWAKQQTGRATLPMSVRAARFRAAGPQPGPLRCVVRAVGVGEQHAVCDLSLARPDGVVVASLDGLELVARPR
jgi:NAD(P)-dependent dehydrogenase (short-subunit alcohol dehydrogenase family)